MFQLGDPAVTAGEHPAQFTDPDFQRTPVTDDVGAVFGAVVGAVAVMPERAHGGHVHVAS